MTIILPLRTVSEANRRDHWATKAKRVARQRGVTGMVLLNSLRGLRGPVMVLLARVAPLPLDDDNLRGALKAVRDGVADALGVNDNDPRVTWEYAQRRGKPGEYAVEIQVERRGQ